MNEVWNAIIHIILTYEIGVQANIKISIAEFQPRSDSKVVRESTKLEVPGSITGQGLSISMDTPWMSMVQHPQLFLVWDEAN